MPAHPNVKLSLSLKFKTEAAAAAAVAAVYIPFQQAVSWQYLMLVFEKS